MVVPLVVWLALQILVIAAPLVATFRDQLVTAAPVFLIVTLWQKPPLHELVVASVAVTEPETAVAAACSTVEKSSADSDAQPPRRLPMMIERKIGLLIRFMVTLFGLDFDPSRPLPTNSEQ